MGTRDGSSDNREVPKPKRQKLFGLAPAQGQRPSYQNVVGASGNRAAAPPAVGLRRVPNRTMLPSGTRLPLQAIPRRPPTGSIVGIMRPLNKITSFRSHQAAGSSTLATARNLSLDASGGGSGLGAPQAGGFLAKLSARATPGGAAATTMRKLDTAGASSMGMAGDSKVKSQQKAEPRVIKCLQKPSHPPKGERKLSDDPALEPSRLTSTVGARSALGVPAASQTVGVDHQPPREAKASAAPATPTVTPLSEARAGDTQSAKAAVSEDARPCLGGKAEGPTSQGTSAGAVSSSSQPPTAAAVEAPSAEAPGSIEGEATAQGGVESGADPECDEIVDESSWRDTETAVEVPKSDIRSFFSVKSLPPPIKCPLLPVVPLAKPVPARFWRQVMRCYQTDSHRALTRSAALRLIWGRFGVLPSTLDCATGSVSLVADPASWLEFDALGSLLAVGTLNGVLRIYDFDEYVTSLSSFRTDAGGGQVGGATPPTKPIQVLYPRKGVSMLRWHPDASAELACAFTHFNQVYVYDLEAWSVEPTRVYQVGHRAKGSAGGNLSLTFARHPSARGGGCFMVTGSTYGMLRCWDMKRTDRLYWEVKLRSSQAINAVASSGNYLVASCSEHVTIWDVHRLQVPCMGAEPIPTLLWTLENVGTVQSLWPRELPVPHMFAVTSSGQLVRIDMSIGKVVGGGVWGLAPPTAAWTRHLSAGSWVRRWRCSVTTRMPSVCAYMSCSRAERPWRGMGIQSSSYGSAAQHSVRGTRLPEPSAI